MCSMRSFALACSASVMLVGCNGSPPTPVHRADPHEAMESIATMTNDAKIVELFEQFNRLPENEQDSLKGDRLMLQIEFMLGSASKKTQETVAPTLESHNRKLIKRAMEDTSADPIKVNNDLEFLGPPRENKPTGP